MCLRLRLHFFQRECCDGTRVSLEGIDGRRFLLSRAWALLGPPPPCSVARGLAEQLGKRAPARVSIPKVLGALVVSLCGIAVGALCYVAGEVDPAEPPLAGPSTLRPWTGLGTGAGRQPGKQVVVATL